MSDSLDLDNQIRKQQERLKHRAEPEKTPHVHIWGTAYQSSSGRRVCTECGFVTDKPFETLGPGESEK